MVYFWALRFLDEKEGGRILYWRAYTSLNVWALTGPPFVASIFLFSNLAVWALLMFLNFSAGMRGGCGFLVKATGLVFGLRDPGAFTFLEPPSSAPPCT